MTTGERIRQLRKEAGLTQKQLGEKCGIAEPTIRKYELGKLKPKIETLIKIANALNVNVSAFSHDNVIYFNNIPDKKIEEMSSEEIKATFRKLSLDEVMDLFSRFEDNLIEKYPESVDLLKLYYNELNVTGKKEALKRIRELTKIKEYTE